MCGQRLQLDRRCPQRFVFARQVLHLLGEGLDVEADPIVHTGEIDQRGAHRDQASLVGLRDVEQAPRLGVVADECLALSPQGLDLCPVVPAEYVSRPVVDTAAVVLFVTVLRFDLTRRGDRSIEG